MKCPVCGKGPLKRDKRNLAYTYEGNKTVILAVSGDFCKTCGEAIPDADESARVSAAMLEFNRQVNADH